MNNQLSQQKKKNRLSAIIVGTVLDREILRGEFAVLPMPITEEDLSLLITRYKDTENMERNLSESWAEINCEPETINPCGITIRLVPSKQVTWRNKRFGTKKELTDLDSIAPSFTINFAKSDLTTRQIVGHVNAAAKKMQDAFLSNYQ